MALNKPFLPLLGLSRVDGKKPSAVSAFPVKRKLWTHTELQPWLSCLSQGAGAAWAAL